MADDVNVQQAIAELGKMANFAKAFADAGIVLSALANAEQVGKELDGLNAARRADLDGATAKLANVQAEALKAVQDGQAVMAQARADADAIKADAARQGAEALAAAKQEAEGVVAAAEATAATVTAQAAAATAELADVSAKLEAVQAELAADQAKLDQARSTLKAMLNV